jgi:hypothetical protein
VARFSKTTIILSSELLQIRFTSSKMLLQYNSSYVQVQNRVPSPGLQKFLCGPGETRVLSEERAPRVRILAIISQFSVGVKGDRSARTHGTVSLSHLENSEI